ncbi:MAG: four helix bundle protein [Bacteroidales bacterium]
MKSNVIKEKSYAFAVRVINLTRELRKRKVEAVLINQLLKSGTSIAANVEEAVAGISKAEFSMKLSISYKEAKETGGWLRMLKDTASISTREFDSLYQDLEEIMKILWAILKTTRMK